MKYLNLAFIVFFGLPIVRAGDRADIKNANQDISEPAMSKLAEAFVGEWCNIDFNTGGVTRIHIRNKDSGIVSQMWGRCHPVECDWGNSTAEIQEGGNVLSIEWNPGFAKSLQKLTILPSGILELITHTQYTDNSGRTNYKSIENFAKGLKYDWTDPKDESEVLKRLQNVADQGYSFAQYQMGGFYLVGKGVHQDESKAVELFKNAANQGYSPAQKQLGECYLKGIGVAKDEVEAFKWFQKSADQENASAQERTGWCYLNGFGINKDDAEAVRWFRAAAKKGNDLAKFHLGQCYLKGEGVPKDTIEAYALFNIAGH